MIFLRLFIWLADLLVDGPHREFELGDLTESLRRTHADRGTLALLHEGLALVARLTHRKGSLMLEDLRNDGLLALRQVVRTPRVFLGGAAVLAVGLGVGAFAWGVPYGTFGRGVQVEWSDRLAVFGTTVPFRSDGQFASPTRWDVRLSDRDLLEGLPGLVFAGLWRDGTVNWVDGVGPATRASTRVGSPEILPAMGLESALGRLLVPGDTALASPLVAVISHSFWTARLAGDPGVIGRTVELNGNQTEIVGVLEPGGRFPNHADLWLPHHARIVQPSTPFSVMGRMVEGATPSSVAGQFQARLDGLQGDRREEWEGSIAFGRPLTEGFRTIPLTRQNRVLGWAGALLMIMSLANVANLFLVRAQTRAQELAVRRALGAGGGRILRQLAVEAAVPAVIGIAGALAIASYGLDFYDDSWQATGYLWWVWKLEMPHMAIIALGALLSTVVVTLIVGGHELRKAASGSLRSSKGSHGMRFRLGYGLVGVEVAVGSALLLIAALMVRSSWNLRTLDLGFETESVITGRVVLEGDAYSTPEAQQAFWSALQAELEVETGVASATITTQLPFVRGGLQYIEIEGEPVEDWRNLRRRYLTAATPSFFETFEARLVRGRVFDASDVSDGPPVAVVNDDFVRSHFSDGEAIGRRFRVWMDGDPGPWREVVGIVPHLWMDSEENRFPQGFYVPLAQYPTSSARVAIRVAGPVDAFDGTIASVVSRIDSSLPVDEVRTMPQWVRARTSLYRRTGPIFTALGFSALFLSVLGLHAVLSYLTSLRRTEFGIRSALGATSRELVGRGVRRSVLPVMVGIGVGLTIGLALIRGFERFLFEVEPNDPWVTLAATALLLATCAAASAAPAWRASRIAPTAILRAED